MIAERSPEIVSTFLPVALIFQSRASTVVARAPFLSPQRSILPHKGALDLVPFDFQIACRLLRRGLR